MPNQVKYVRGLKVDLGTLCDISEGIISAGGTISGTLNVAGLSTLAGFTTTTGSVTSNLALAGGKAYITNAATMVIVGTSPVVVRAGGTGAGTVYTSF